MIKGNADTDPTNGTSDLRLTNFSRATSGESFYRSWASVPFKTYQVETSPISGFQPMVQHRQSGRRHSDHVRCDRALAPTHERRLYRVKVLP
jgi:hypothetical protein